MIGGGDGGNGGGTTGGGGAGGAGGCGGAGGGKLGRGLVGGTGGGRGGSGTPGGNGGSIGGHFKSCGEMHDAVNPSSSCLAETGSLPPKKQKIPDRMSAPMLPPRSRNPWPAIVSLVPPLRGPPRGVTELICRCAKSKYVKLRPLLVNVAPSVETSRIGWSNAGSSSTGGAESDASQTTVVEFTTMAPTLSSKPKRQTGIEILLGRAKP